MQKFTKFLIDFGFDKINSVSNLKYELELFYPEYTMEELQHVFEIYSNLNDKMNKLIIYEKEYNPEYKNGFMKFHKQRRNDTFYKKGLSIDLSRAYYNTFTIYKNFNSEIMDCFFVWKTYIDEELRKSSTAEELLSKFMYNKLITMISKKFKVFSEIRRFIVDVMDELKMFLISKHASIIKHNFDGIYTDLEEFDKSFLDDVFLSVTEFKNMLFVKSNEYLFQIGEDIKFKGFSYAYPRILFDWVERIYKKEITVNQIYNKNFVKKNFNVLPLYVLRDRRGSDNLSVKTKTGFEDYRKIDNIEDVDVDYYIDTFNEKFGVLLKEVIK